MPKGWQQEIRRWLFDAQGGLCHYCKRLMVRQGGNTFLACTTEHLVPLSEAGTWAIENLAAACRQCNNARGVIPVALFARYVRKFGPPDHKLLSNSNWMLRRRAPRAIASMRANGMAEEIINDVMRQKLEAAIIKKIALLEAAEREASA